ncbi:acyloxyacyl hydrolase [Shewanella vesiculosa]|uniref:acyloxyacyl hydrolase n=1 Tax=Shewanella vesiculosa TaxID=518738 RepID=UPI00384BBC21
MRSLLTAMGLLLIFSPAYSATQGVAIDYLLGEKQLQGIRLAYRPFYTNLTEFSWLGDLDVYWEMSANFWEIGHKNKHETNYAVAISPVFSSQFASIDDKYPVKWEFGIGVSLVGDTRFAGKNMGSHYQFEDRLGVLIEFGDDLKKYFAIRYMHYSNGGLNNHNPGLDFLNLSYAMRF